MLILNNLVEERATQIQAVHSKYKEIQIALSTMFRSAYYPFAGGGMLIIQQLNKVKKGRQKRRLLEEMIICSLNMKHYIFKKNFVCNKVTPG